MMKRVFVTKKKEPLVAPNEEAFDRITKLCKKVDEKIRKLDAALISYREQIKKTQPGPAREAIKARAVPLLKQKRTYEGQLDMLRGRTLILDQVAFAANKIKDARQTSSKGQGLRQFSRSFMCPVTATCCLTPESSIAKTKSSSSL
ncbi:vacuolar protein sorting-associated protein 60.1-like [Punica granatum]|uniref:Vacuolar protein sorting-associated protein 60.1-like n=2 Tax=Punica granatum TaxID=22663 RepID=A0A6P8CB67_PUNGR|nr:vacuolar protein sorting-associated protein 60.1-like [Punica granatum]PKI32741.1 hypothetical protein CRG98_046869 [Punica granatum]